MRISWRRTAIYGFVAGLIGVTVRNHLQLRAEITRLRRMVITDDIMIGNALTRGYFYFEDRQAIVIAKTDPVLLKPAEGYFRNSGILVFIPVDLTTDDLHEALKDTAYYLEPNAPNRGLPAGSALVLKRDEWDSAPLPNPQLIADILAHFFRENGITDS
jgi:hypothetical protein